MLVESGKDREVQEDDNKFGNEDLASHIVKKMEPMISHQITEEIRKTAPELTSSINQTVIHYLRNPPEKTARWLSLVIAKIILFLIGIIGGALLSYYATSKSELIIYILNSTTIAENKEERSKISIFYTGKQYKQITKTTIKVANKGFASIKATDFESVLKLSFSEGVFDYEKGPSDLADNIEPVYKLVDDNTALEIKVPLLNGNNNFSFDIISENPLKIRLSSGAVTGQNKIDVINAETQLPEKIEVNIFLLFLLTLSILLLIFSNCKHEAKSEKIKAYTKATVYSFLCFILVFFVVKPNLLENLIRDGFQFVNDFLTWFFAKFSSKNS